MPRGLFRKQILLLWTVYFKSSQASNWLQGESNLMWVLADSWRVKLTAKSIGTNNPKLHCLLCLPLQTLVSFYYYSIIVLGIKAWIVCAMQGLCL